MHCFQRINSSASYPYRHSIVHHAGEKQSKLKGIKASLLIPGRGEPVKDGAVVIHEDKIEWAGAQADLPPKFRPLNFTKVPVLMPGLWDCHVHFFGGSPFGETDYRDNIMNHALAGARVCKDLERTLQAGFTSVREVGGFAGEISPAIQEGTIAGPNVYSSIAPLSMTAGHGDIHDLDLLTMRDACAHGLTYQICDGVPDCILAVRRMIRRGARLIKVCATGGVISIVDDPEDVQFSPEELKAIVDEAARAKRIVAAHCHGKQGTLHALHAGVKTIEHGSYLDEECVTLMKEKGVILVATRLVVEFILRESDKIPPLMYRKAAKLANAHKLAYALAVKSGVRIALGTDQGSGDPESWNGHGNNGRELVFAVEAGMTPLEAIEACTATSPETLGEYMAPKSGQLKAGYDADIIAVSQNPLEDISILTGPKNVTHVWKAGKLFKSPA